MSRATDIPLCVSDRFKVENEIAKGKFGVVYQCQDKSSGRLVAVKVMKKRHNKKEDVEKEVTVMKEMRHPNLLEFVDYIAESGNFILVTELLSGGELFDYCVTKDYLQEAEAIFFMKQILDGLEYMHSQNICHLDLKPENIVLKDKVTKELKIIDFGTCQDLTKNKDIKAMAGTPEFIAPEVLNYDPVTCAADMWAIGVITFCLLTGCSPFLGDNDAETIQNVTLAEFEFPEPDPDEGYEDISESAKEFISQLLIFAPKKRLTSNDALKHRWINSLDIVSTTSRISTDRLKKLRRRRKLLAAIQAVRISVGLLRTFRTQTISGTQPSQRGYSPTEKTMSMPRRVSEPKVTMKEMSSDSFSSPSPSPSPSPSSFGSLSPLVTNEPSGSSPTVSNSPGCTENVKTTNGHL